MADEANLVNNWFSANPNATQADVASAVQSIGGLTPDLASALATHYGTTADVVNNAYSQLTSSTPTPTPTPVNTASSPLSSGNNSTSNSSPIATPSYTQYTPDQIQTLNYNAPNNQQLRYFGGNQFSGPSNMYQTSAGATGGLVALAKGGGVHHYDDGGNVNPAASTAVLQQNAAQPPAAPAD